MRKDEGNEKIVPEFLTQQIRHSHVENKVIRQSLLTASYSNPENASYTTSTTILFDGCSYRT